MHRVHSDSALALAASVGKMASAACFGPAGLGGAYGAAPPAVAYPMPPHAHAGRGALWAPGPGPGVATGAPGLPAMPRVGGIHRSQSMGLLGVPQPVAAHSSLMGRPLPGGGFNTLLGMPQHDAGLGTAASDDLLSLQRSHSASLAGLVHHQPAAAPGSASALQLSAVLSNLAALQRTGSFLGPGASNAGALVEEQLLQLGALHHQHQHQQDPPPRAPDSHDIARLSSMLAGQSLSLPLDEPTTTMLLMSSPGQAATSAAATLGAPPALPAHLLCPLSGHIMVDPVIAADGVTYSRAAIAEWMAKR